MTPPPIIACLGLDQAARTGWAIGAWRDGLPPTFIRYGIARDCDERTAVVKLALEYAGNNPRQLLVMFEQHDGIALDYRTAKDHRSKRRGPHFVERGPKQVHGMGKAYGRWEEQLDIHKHPESLRDEVEPRTWRARVLGTTRGDTDQLKHLACTWATQRLCEAIEDADEAEGICICAFAMYDGVARLTQRRQRVRVQARGRREEKRQLELGTPRPPPKEAVR
jgi:hypothetical protein